MEDQLSVSGISVAMVVDGVWERGWRWVDGGLVGSRYDKMRLKVRYHWKSCLRDGENNYEVVRKQTEKGDTKALYAVSCRRITVFTYIGSSVGWHILAITHLLRSRRLPISEPCCHGALYTGSWGNTVSQ